MIRSAPVLFLALAAPLAAQSPTTTAVTSTSATTTSSLAPLERSGSYANAYAGGTPHNSLIASQLADSMPHYEPPKPKPAPKPAAEVDLRDVDRPKNHINRLPAYLVHGDKPPIFADKVSETHTGRALLGLQKYKGLNLTPILNRPIAEQMQYDDERLQNMADLQDEASAIGRGVRSDAAEKEFIQEASQNMYMRQDSGYTPRAPGG